MEAFFSKDMFFCIQLPHCLHFTFYQASPLSSFLVNAIEIAPNAFHRSYDFHFEKKFHKQTCEHVAPGFWKLHVNLVHAWKDCLTEDEINQNYVKICEHSYPSCHNPNLGLMTKARAWKGEPFWGQKQCLVHLASITPNL
jgi:hypothetical protein